MYNSIEQSQTTFIMYINTGQPNIKMQKCVAYEDISLAQRQNVIMENNPAYDEIDVTI